MVFERDLFGIMKSGFDAKGRRYHDWRSAYFNIPGVIKVFRSEHHDGYYIYFLPYEEDNPMQRYIRTSLGKIEEDEGFLTIKTQNSTYCFGIDEDCLSEEDKVMVRLYAYRMFAK